MISIGDLRRACSHCDTLRWCNEGVGCKVGEHHCKHPYSLCKQEDKEAVPV